MMEIILFVNRAAFVMNIAITMIALDKGEFPNIIDILLIFVNSWCIHYLERELFEKRMREYNGGINHANK